MDLGLWGHLACPVLSLQISEPTDWCRGPCDKNKIKSLSIFEFSLGKGVYLLLHCERYLISILY